MMTAGQLAETFERIRLGEHTPEDWVGLEDHIATLTAELEQAKAERDLADEATQFYNRKAADAIILRDKAEAELRESRLREAMNTHRF
jgi:hypothetical protein